MEQAASDRMEPSADKSQDIQPGSPEHRKLLEGNERCKVILNNMVDAVASIDERGVVQGFNAAAERMFGYSSDEVVGQNINILMPSPYREEHDQYLAKYLQTGKQNIIGIGREVEALKKDGTTFPVYLSVSEVSVPSSDGSVPLRLFTGILRDLTQEKAAQEALRLSEERLKLALEATTEGHWDWDITTGHLYFSEMTIKSLGFPADEVEPSLSFWKSLLHPDEKDQVLEALEAHLKGQTPKFEYEYRLRRKSGEYHWNYTRGKVIVWDKAGNPLRMVGTEVDCTERHHRQDELKEAKEAAEIANRSKSEFLANMSHEIRTPMTAILGFNDIILDSVTDPDCLDAARTVKENGEHLLNLINDILDLSKIESGILTVENVDCSPHDVVCEVVNLMSVRAAAKGLPLNARFLGALPEKIKTDPTRLRQVMINIVGNAIKFTETGSVQILTHLIDRNSSDPKLQFDITDTGIGIAEEQLVKLFENFSQADTSMTRQFGGSGLGLAISRRLIKLLSGNITVTSTLGQGSTFTITIPTGHLQDARLTHLVGGSSSAAANADISSSSKHPLEGYRILFAEDGPDNQRLISFILKKAGAEVTLADNGQIAFILASAALAEGRPFDLILMDMQMPVLDGYSATRQLRDTNYTGPIIALTAHAMSTDRQKCLDAGCDEYFTKPVDRTEFIEMVKGYLNRVAEEAAAAQYSV